MARTRLGAAIDKEFRQFLRDPVLLFLHLWLYTAEVAICGAALTFDLREEAVGALDLDHTRSSQELVERFDRTPTFRVRHRPSDLREARRLLDEGSARLVLVIPHGFEERLVRSGEDGVQILADGTNSMMAMVAVGAARRLAAFATRDLRGTPSTGPPRGPVVENRVRVWYNPNVRFADFVVVTMIAIGSFMVVMVLPAASIVKEKERGTMEQLLVSPLRPYELIASKILPTLVLGLVALGPSVLVALAFGVPLRGDPATLAIASAAFLLSAIGIGVFIATFVRTLQQVLLVVFFVIVPAMAISGTMVPLESMPPALRLLSRLSPLRYYVEALLGLFLRGAGLDVIWPQVVWMLAIGVPLLGSSVYLFRKRLE